MCRFKNLSWLLFCFVVISGQVAAQSEDFAIIKARVVQELLRNPVGEREIQSVLERMKADGSFGDINYLDLSRRAGFPHRHHTHDLVLLVKAFATEDSQYYQKGTVKQRIIDGLSYWVAHDFFGDNWHNNQISTPTNMVNLMLIIGDELPKDLVEKAQPMIGRAHMNASGARPSGDRIVIAGILAKNLLFLGKKKEFGDIIRLIEGEVKFSTGKRGMQHDYSFHHRVDRVNNTTSYGYGKYANAFGEWSYYVSGTSYAFSKEKINHLVDYYLDGIYKQLVYGVYDDISVKNRSITHKAIFKPKATLEIERLLHGTDYRRGELLEVIKLRQGEIQPSNSFCKFFWQTEHFVFQRPTFYTTVRMFSTRNRNMEVPYNGPGKPTHHRADGTNYLMLRGDEYHNIWPVYDWQKISGTTILQKPALHHPDDIQKDGLTDFVGAVTDGMYGAVVFDFRSPHDMVKAKKAWFFYDDIYICLGNSIASNASLPVATTLNQVLMRSDVIISQNGETAKLVSGSHVLDDVAWIHQDRVGYIFPDPAAIHVSNQSEGGRWSDITDQKNISEELVSEDVFTAWYDHGSRPRDASYAYMVLPDVSLEEMQSESNRSNHVEILANSPEVQAVNNRKLGLGQIVFHRAGQVQITEDHHLSMESQGMAMVAYDGTRIKKLSVSDPSRRLSKILISVSGKYDVGHEHVQFIQDHDDTHTTMVVQLPQGVYAGKSVVIEF